MYAIFLASTAIAKKPVFDIAIAKGSLNGLLDLCLLHNFEIFSHDVNVVIERLFGIAIAKANVNGTIDNIQFPLFLGIANTNAIAQCERTLSS